MKNLKKIFALITVICMLASTMTVVFADDVTYSFKYDYDDANNTATVIGFEIVPTEKTDILIPATVKKGGKTYNVTAIGVDAFRNNGQNMINGVTFGTDVNGNYQIKTLGNQCFATASITSIVMPDTITTILGINNFYACSSLASVTLSNNIDSSLTDGTGMFTNCKALKEVHLPTGSKFTKIPSKMFRGCELDKLYIPDNVKEAPNDAFVNSGYTAWVNEVYGDGGVFPNTVKAKDGSATKVYATNFSYVVLDETNKTCAVNGLNGSGKLIGAIYMPDTIDGYTVTAFTYQNGNLFVNQKDLTEFYMADTITKIIPPDNSTDTNHYNNMFYGCENLKKLHLSNNLTGVIRNICLTTTKITEIEIPAGVTIIDRSFRNQTNLKSVRTAPNSKLQKVIGGSGGSFDGCAGIEEFVILGSELEEFNPFYLIATTREDVIAKNPNLTIFTDNEEYAASTGILGMFANSYNFNISTDFDTKIMIDKVETSDSGVTATLRSRAYGFNKSAESVKVICAVYNSNDTLAKIKMVNTEYDFTNSLLQEVVFDDVTVADDQNVKVFVLKDTVAFRPDAKAYDLKGDNRNIKYYAIGHSYLLHGAFEGWQTTGEWGMASSAPEFDYFHQFQKNLVDNLDCDVIALPENQSLYEVLCTDDATEEKYTKSEQYAHMKEVIETTKPNVITICVGGNLKSTKNDCIEKFYDVLFKMVKDTITAVNDEDSTANYNPVVVFVPAFTRDIIGAPIAKNYGFAVADATFIHDNGSVNHKNNPYYAFIQYPDYDPTGKVEFRTHPGDDGHKAIADTIFRAAKDEILKKIPANNDVTTEYDEEYGYTEYGKDNGGGTATEIKITTNPKNMKVKFNGFNVKRDDTNDWVVLSSVDDEAGAKGASVSAENLSISSDYSKFYVTIRVDGEISGKNMLFKYTTASGTHTMTLPMVKEMNTYEFNISSVKEEITSVVVTPDLSKCTLYIKNMGFEK